MKKTEEIYTAELDDEEARKDSEELATVMLDKYLDDPSYLSDFEKGLLFALQFNKVFDGLVDEQKWIWGKLAPAMLNINEIIDCYRDNKPHKELGRTPTKDDLEFFFDSYTSTPNHWFRDFQRNLYDRKTVFEKALAEDIDFTLWRLTLYLYPEWWQHIEQPLPKDPGSKILQLDKDTIRICLENPEEFIYGQVTSEED